MTLLIFKKSQLGVCPVWGGEEKKKGRKVGRPDEKTRSGWSEFHKTKEFVKTKTRICMWDKADWQEDMMSQSHGHTVVCLDAVAPRSHNLPPERITHTHTHTAVLYYTCLNMVIARTGLISSTTDRQRTSCKQIKQGERRAVFQGSERTNWSEKVWGGVEIRKGVLNAR